MLAFTIWPILTGLFFLAVAALRVMFTLAVFNDASRIQSSGRDLFLVGPAIWAAAALLGGLPGVALYWLAHYYSARTPQVRPPTPTPAPAPVPPSAVSRPAAEPAASADAPTPLSPSVPVAPNDGGEPLPL